jgi:two-component system cell cycle response regulator DivK
MGNNILYIEDNPDNMLLVQRALESRGYRLLKAANGVDGISMAEESHIDLILLDINLPDLDGYEVAQRLRKSSKPALAYVPIIAITANALKGDAERALNAGCDVYMSKPINIRELWARIDFSTAGIFAAGKPSKPCNISRAMATERVACGSLAGGTSRASSFKSGSRPMSCK